MKPTPGTEEATYRVFVEKLGGSPISEFVGEFGLIGFILIFFSIMIFFMNKNSYTFINMIIMSYTLIILFFDFSMHIPIIQIMLIIFLTLNKKK